MATVTGEQKKTFTSKSAPYIEAVKKTLKKEAELARMLESGTVDPAETNILLCREMLNAGSQCLAVNSLSEELLGMKNVGLLDDGRKLIQKALEYLEAVVTNKIDVPYADYESNVNAISFLSIEDRLMLIKKLGLAIDMIVNAYGDDSRLKWTFVELHGHFATAAKNIVDMRRAIKVYFSSTDAEYGVTESFLNLIKRELDKAATDYYTRFSAATRSVDDVRLAINFLEAERRLCMLLRDTELASQLAKKVSVWQSHYDLQNTKN
jgi:hypothetical protein